MSDVTIRRVRPDDTGEIARCLRLCYGDTYPKVEFYDPDLLAGMIAKHEHDAVVAVVGERLVAHMGWPAIRWWPRRGLPSSTPRYEGGA